jgi:7-cyano-7-deazaguanine synthase
MTKALLLCSGGLDSTTLAHWMRDQDIEIVPIFLDYGQHCVEKEWKTLQRVLPTKGVKPAERIDVSGIFRGSRSRLIVEANLWAEPVADDDLYVPYRTLLFFSIGAACAQTRGLTDVYSGFINSNHAKELDCSADFLNGLGALSANIGPVRFHMPFRDWSKTQVVAEAMRLKVAIGGTFSCQIFSDTPSGA